MRCGLETLARAAAALGVLLVLAACMTTQAECTFSDGVVRCRGNTVVNLADCKLVGDKPHCPVGM